MRRLPIILIATAMFATACGGGGNSLLNAASGDWCDLAQKVDDADNAMDDPTAAGLRDLAKQVKASAAAAPPEIKADVELMGQFADDLANALEQNDDNVFLAFDSISDELSDPKFSDAGDRIDAYNERECGITNTSSSDTGSSDTGPSNTESFDTESFDTGSTDATPNPFDTPDVTNDPAFPEGGLIAGLAQEMGVTEDQARCLFSALDFTASETPPVGEMINAFTDCGIDPLTLGG